MATIGSFLGLRFREAIVADYTPHLRPAAILQTAAGLISVNTAWMLWHYQGANAAQGVEFMIEDIIVNLTPGEARDAAADYAISVASALEAHLAGIAFIYDPVIPATIMGGGIPADLIEAQRVESERGARAAASRFNSAAQQAGLSFETHEIAASAAGAADRFSQLARRFDLSVVGQPEPEGPMTQDLVLETALFQSGRPVLAVPYIQKSGLKLDRVMVCWDGGRTAARAIGDAMPLLTRAKAVELVIFAGERGKQDELPGVDMAQHLARHKLKVTVSRMPLGDVEVADAILSHAADSAADFLVMGGYGHSRLREFILGGATRGILQAMTVPTLLSH
jgi:nucleotide-binding universal stress UspA family protein